MDTKGTMDIYLYPGGAQARALIKKGKLFNQKGNSARGSGRGKRLPVSETPTVEFRHLELSRVTEPVTKEKDVPPPTTLHHHLLQRMLHQRVRRDAEVT